MQTYRVFDDRSNHTLLKTKDKWEAMEFLFQNFDEDHPDFKHVWIEEIN